MIRTSHRSLRVLLALLSTLICAQAIEAQVSPGPTVRRSRHIAILQRGVHVLDERSLALLTRVSEDHSMLVFQHPTPQLNRIMGGDVIVAGVGERTPYGLLRRVTEVSRERSDVILLTEHATVEDVFWFGRAQETFQMSASDVRGVRTHTQGVQVRGLTPDGLIAPRADRSAPEGSSAEALTPDVIWSPDPIEVDLFDVVLFDLDQDPTTTDDQVTVSGLVGIAPTFDLDLGISWGRVQKFSFINKNDLYSTLDLEGHVFIPLLDEELTIASFYFSPIIIMVGPVPVVFAPVLDIKAGAIANLSADVETSVTAKVLVTVGVIYENGQWRSITEFPDSIDDIEVEWKTPQLSADAYAQVYAGPKFYLLVYGIVGPYANVLGYSELSANFLPDAAWALYLGVRGNIGVENKVPIFGPPLTVPVFDRKWKIAEGSLIPF